MKRRFLQHGVAVLAISALPVAAMAQSAATTPAPAAPMAAPAPAAPAKQHPHNVALLKNTSKNVDAHIAELHSQLQITSAEEPQWAQFAQVMRDNAAQMDAAFQQRGQQLQTMTAVQDLQSYAQLAQVQSDTMQKLSTAFQTLYASFPPAQQKVADGVFQAQTKKFRH